MGTCLLLIHEALSEKTLEQEGECRSRFSRQPAHRRQDPCRDRRDIARIAETSAARLQRRLRCCHWFFRMNQVQLPSRRHLLRRSVMKPCGHRSGLKGTQKRARKRALLGPQWFQGNPHNSFGMNGGDDGTRTRGLCRDSTVCQRLSSPYCTQIWPSYGISQGPVSE